MEYPKHITVTTAESITGGRLQAQLTNEKANEVDELVKEFRV